MGFYENDNNLFFNYYISNMKNNQKNIHEYSMKIKFLFLLFFT